MAASLGLAGSARAALPGDPSFQPLRRPGMEGKRFGMLVDRFGTGWMVLHTRGCGEAAMPEHAA